MPIDIGIEQILVFCIVQTLLLIIVLLQKRFHQIPNLFLGMMFGLLTSFYILYLLEEIQLFDNYPSLKTLKRGVELFPPPFIYNYLWLLVHGETKFRKESIRHFILPAIAIILIVAVILITLIPSFPAAVSYQIYYYVIVAGSIIVGFQFIYFSYKLILLILAKSKSNDPIWKSVLVVSDKRYRWVRLMAIIFFLHGSIFLIEGVYLSIYPDDPAPLLINTIFYITLGYIFTINLIQNPSIIHFSRKSAGDLALRKYEKSGLSEDEAKAIMKKMNEFMDSEKPYVNSNLSIQDLSESVAIPVHTISEITNGLMGQNFFDYVNNYRVEEFKRLAKESKEEEVKILHLAFDAGFSSKTSFNTAFKKFTGNTPSQYMKEIKG